MLFIPLIGIPLVFFAAAFMKPAIQGRFPSLQICSICAAVFLTWLLLLALQLTSFDLDPLPIGILMGMSVAGVMYKMEAAYKKHGLRFLWLARLTVVLGGFYGVVFLLQGQWSIAFFIGIFTLVAITMISFLFQGITHEDAVRTASADEEKKSLLKKLDNCC